MKRFKSVDNTKTDSNITSMDIDQPSSVSVVASTSTSASSHSQYKKPNPVTERLSQILKKIDIIIDDELKEENIQTIEILSAIILQSIIGCFMPKAILDVFDRILKVTNCWTQYRIARSASRLIKYQFFFSP